MSVPPWLIALGIPESCIFHQSSAEEKKCSFSIQPQRGNPHDEIWKVKLDDCWFQDDIKKVDYLFWGQSASGRRVILLVELKGEDFNKALQQIESTLQHLCKKIENNIVHTGNHRQSPGHALSTTGGIRAHVVLSKGKGVPLRLKEQEKLRKRYSVIVYHHEQRFEVKGLDNLLKKV